MFSTARVCTGAKSNEVAFNVLQHKTCVTATKKQMPSVAAATSTLLQTLI
jgi:hypothetical protein